MMDVREARTLAYELLSTFFSGANVKYSRQANIVKPAPPLVTLTTVSVRRPLTPPQRIVDGVPVCYYPTTMALQIDLYTRGSPVQQQQGYITPTENTALNDLIEFANYVSSEYVVNWCHENDVTIVLSGQAQDTTALINNSSFEFRATLELSMSFTQEAIGYAGILDRSSIKSTPNGSIVDPEFSQSASGGGTEELAKESIGYFTEAETTYKEE